jgi:hypothetical protein
VTCLWGHRWGRRYSANPFSSSALEVGRWLAPRHVRFTPLERRGTHCTGGWVDLETHSVVFLIIVLQHVEKHCLYYEARGFEFQPEDRLISGLATRQTPRRHTTRSFHITLRHEHLPA